VGVSGLLGGDERVIRDGSSIDLVLAREDGLTGVSSVVRTGG
jgi:hypothetical protein